jgi:hypothetical protein
MSLILTSAKLAVAYIADLAFDDPLWLPHPVRLSALRFGDREAGSPNCEFTAVLRIAGLLARLCISQRGRLEHISVAEHRGPALANRSVVVRFLLAFATLSVRSLHKAAKEVIVIQELRGRNLERARTAYKCDIHPGLDDFPVGVTALLVAIAGLLRIASSYHLVWLSTKLVEIRMECGGSSTES